MRGEPAGRGWGHAGVRATSCAIQARLEVGAEAPAACAAAGATSVAAAASATAAPRTSR